MKKDIKNFNQQFGFKPKIENEDKLGEFERFVIAGMGGSNLVGDLLKIRDPGLEIISHRNYGLPSLAQDRLKQKTLIIANSYSGNTQETLSAFQKAIDRELPVAAVTTGGKLLELAKKYQVPYIQMPDTGLQPRSALGFNLRAVLKILGRKDLLKESSALVSELDPEQQRKKGKKLALKLKDRIPVIYASQKNKGLAYNWKIKFNETGKIPAFYNLFPELNHNEINGFGQKSFKDFSKIFHFIFLKDLSNQPRIKKRMEITKDFYQERGLSVEKVLLKKGEVFYKIFCCLILGDWTAFYTAQNYGFDPKQVPVIEKFKELMRKS